MKWQSIFTAALMTGTIQCSQLTLKQTETSISLSKKVSHLQLTAQGYTLHKRNRVISIPSYDIHKELRKMTPEQLKLYQAKHAIRCRKMNDGSYQVDPAMHLKGGGPAGAAAGCWIGRFLAQAIGYGIVAPVMALPALVLGPVAYGVAVAGTAGTIAPIVETVSTATAVAGGIIGGVITGPA